MYLPSEQWSPVGSEGAPERRQGDILVGSLIAHPAVQFAVYAELAHAIQVRKDFALPQLTKILGKTYFCVLSQCCEWPKREFVHLCRLTPFTPHRYTKLSEEDLAAFKSNELYSRADPKQFHIINQFYFEGRLAVGDEPAAAAPLAREELVADFGQLVSVKKSDIGDRLTKVEELTPAARKKLRDKLSNYFGRVAEEDEASLGHDTENASPPMGAATEMFDR